MDRTKAIPMIAYIGIAALLQAANSPSAAQDKGLGSISVDSYGYVLQSVVAIDGKVVCSQIIMQTGNTSPCKEFTAPPKVAVGETFSADGKTRHAFKRECKQSWKAQKKAA